MPITYEQLTRHLPQLPVDIVQRFGVEKHGTPLRTDGIVGPKTKSAEYVDPANQAHPLVAYAVGEAVAGAREYGHNEGPWVVKYMGSEAWEGGSWCAGFVSWCLNTIYGDTPYIRGARRLVDALAKQGQRVQPEDIAPGDVIGWERESTTTAYAGHVGIVCEVTDTHVYTIEGNVGPRGEVRVFRYSRSENLRRGDQPVWGIARWES